MNRYDSATAFLGASRSIDATAVYMAYFSCGVKLVIKLILVNTHLQKISIQKYLKVRNFVIQLTIFQTSVILLFTLVVPQTEVWG
jgi:hypothetical protein